MSCYNIGLEYLSQQNQALKGGKPCWGVLPTWCTHTSAYRSCVSPLLIWYFYLKPFYFQTHMEIILPSPLPHHVLQLCVSMKQM